MPVKRINVNIKLNQSEKDILFISDFITGIVAADQAVAQTIRNPDLNPEHPKPKCPLH